MFQPALIVALGSSVGADPGSMVHMGPSYAVHVRERAGPERVVHVPLTGSPAVPDAVGALGRAPGDLARMDLWVVRRGAGGRVRVLPVNWTAITRHGVTATNYQILAGDRLFLQARPAR